MTHFVSRAALSLAVLLAAGVALADIAPPGGGPRPRPRPQEVPDTAEARSHVFEVRYEPGAKVSRLILPPEAMKGAPEGGGTGAVPGSAAPGSAPPATPYQGSDASSTRTIIAGTAMSEAIVGLFFVKRGNRVARYATVASVFVAALIGTAAVVWGNAAPPPRPYPDDQPVPVPDKRPIFSMMPISDLAPAVENRRVVIELGKAGDPVILIMAAPKIEPGSGAKPTSTAPVQQSAPIAPPQLNAPPPPG